MKKYQTGKYLPDLGGAIFVLAILIAALGWGVIEGASWLFSHISFSWD